MLAMFSSRSSCQGGDVPAETRTSPTGDVGSSCSVAKAGRVVVAGLDITAWQVVEVSVPAGPLGILLDGSCEDAAVLDDFSPVTRGGAPGAVEASGLVPHGSVLVAMDRVDFVQPRRKSLAEIGAVLRESAHLKRRLRFKVPATASKRALGSQEETPGGDDSAKLLVGPTSSSTSLVGPSKGETAASSSEWASKVWSGLRAATTLVSPPSRAAAPQPAPAPAPASTPDPHAAVASLQASRPGSSSSFVRVTGLEDAGELAAPFAPRSSDSCVTVDVAAGALGLHLDGAVTDRAVVLGFVPLSDGSLGALETHGGVTPGAELVAINGRDVSSLPLAEIRERLGATSAEPRRLVFRLPPPSPARSKTPYHRCMSTGSTRRLGLAASATSSAVFLENVDLRRRLELQLVLRFDRAELKFKECWFLVHASWMTRWAAFVARGGPEPGPVSNHELLLPDWETHLSGDTPGRADVVRAGLQLTQDYRGVTPMVWSLLTALHGSGDAPTLARYVLDIDSETVGHLEVTQVLQEPQPQAMALANKLREQCEVHESASA